MVGRGVVVGVRWGGGRLGSDGSGATTVSCFELLTITNAMTRPMTVSTATAATIHSQRGDFGLGGGGSGAHPADTAGRIGRSSTGHSHKASRRQPLGGRRRQPVPGRWGRRAPGSHMPDRVYPGSCCPRWSARARRRVGESVIPTSWLQGTCEPRSHGLSSRRPILAKEIDSAFTAEHPRLITDVTTRQLPWPKCEASCRERWASRRNSTSST